MSEEMNTKIRKYRINNVIKSALGALDILYIVKTALSNPRQPKMTPIPMLALLSPLKQEFLL